MEKDKYLDSWSVVDVSVTDYYKNRGRSVSRIRESRDDEWGWHYLHYLIDRYKVIRYGFGMDRNLLVGGVEIGIGPEYIRAASFWSYEDSERFLMEVTADAIRHNLELLDEFWDNHPK